MIIPTNFWGHWPNMPWLENRTIFLALSGSRAYNTHTPTSDFDLRGITIPTKEYFFGFLKKFEQAEQKGDPDVVIYDFRKYISLASQCNPNILELMYTDPSDWIICNRTMQKLIDHRSWFLSKKAKFTFLGYAYSQLNRIDLHRQYLLNPPSHHPTREEFGLAGTGLIPRDQMNAAEALIKHRMEDWELDLDDLLPDQVINVQTRIETMLTEIAAWSKTKSENIQWESAATLVGLDDNLISYLTKERRYHTKMREWKQYQDWKTNRNPARAEMEAKYGFDCYSDDTEFLTENGWKKFDDIGSTDKLATIFHKNMYGESEVTNRTYLGIEYQIPTNRLDGIFSGNMYNLAGQHTDVLVTPNHRMFYRKVERNTGVVYTPVLEEVASLPDSFDVLIAPTPNKKNYSDKKIFEGIPINNLAYLTLMGWYLSDGSAQFQESGNKKAISISQKLGGKLSWKMARWNGDYSILANSSLYEYTRESTDFRPYSIVERVLSVREHKIIDRMIDECGYTTTKRIPRWVMGLSKRLKDALLNALLGGDGTTREHKTKSVSYIYYSTLKGLADDVQELALLCGYETALYGPYLVSKKDYPDTIMYQVHIRSEVGQWRRFVRHNNVTPIMVQNARIVCFTVPNGILITRRNGKVGIHGNSKHASHLYRLIVMCQEILENKGVIVKRPDAEIILEIRGGGWSYEKLMEWAKNKEKELDELYKTSTLQKEPQREKIDQLCIELISEWL
jgi:predicted nucleotidyltransferase